MGYIDDKKHIAIHKLQCTSAQSLKAKHGNRVLAAQWEMQGTQVFIADIVMKGLDKMGLLNQITQVISQLHGSNIRRLEIEVNDGIFESKVSLYVHDVKDVEGVIHSLRKIPDIKEVARV